MNACRQRRDGSGFRPPNPNELLPYRDSAFEHAARELALAYRIMVCTLHPLRIFSRVKDSEYWGNPKGSSRGPAQWIYGHR